MIKRKLGLFGRDRRGAAALEFAMVSIAFFPLCIGLVELGVFLWTKNILQSTANLTARCVAISSPACTTPSTFAVNNATTWLMSGVVTSGGVTVLTSTTCSTAPGNVVKVTITSSVFSNLPRPFNGITTSASACYPVSP